MKHAINELQKALDVFKQRLENGTQKADYDPDWEKDIEQGLKVLHGFEALLPYANDGELIQRAQVDFYDPSPDSVEEAENRTPPLDGHDAHMHETLYGDDDLGELDPSKACGFGEEGCSSCQ